MSRVDASAVHEWVAVQFGDPADPGTAGQGISLGIQYTGSDWWEGPTPGGRWQGHFGEFEIQRGNRLHVLRMGANIGENDDPYLVFLLDDAETPVFEFHLQGNRIHTVPEGWWMTHTKQIGLGRDGGSISQQRVLDTTLRNAPHLRTSEFVDLGVILRTAGNPIRGVTGFLHRVLDFIEVRNTLRRAHLAGEPDP